MHFILKCTGYYKHVKFKIAVCALYDKIRRGTASLFFSRFRLKTMFCLHPRCQMITVFHYFLGFKLHTKVLKTIAVSQRIDCIIECFIEPCCRSINYKNTSSTSQNEKNCEMLHNVVYNTSKNELEETPSFDYVYLVNPEKVRGT